MTPSDSHPPSFRPDNPAASNRAALAIALAGLLLLLAFTSWVEYRGLEFGDHPDEIKLLGSVANAMYYRLQLPDRPAEFSAQLLPHWYNYPSFGFDLSCASMALDAHEIMQGHSFQHADQQAVLSALHDRVLTNAVRHRIRAMFLFISLASGVWVFWLVWMLDRSAWECLLAAGITLLGWEYGYHARWIAPDGLVASFCILTIALVFAALRSRRPWGWLLAAAGSAGLTVSSKYTGGVVLLPVLLCAGHLHWRPGQALGPQLRRIGLSWFLCFGIFLGVLLLTTPGIVIEPLKFFSDLNFEHRHYASIGHPGHNTHGFADHATLLARYVCTALLSHYAPAAAFLALLALAGAIIVLIRRPLLHSAVLLLVPVLYPLYLMTQKVMMVRNVMMVVPFLAVLAALAAGEAHRRFGRPGSARNIMKWLIPAVCVGILALNAYWAWYASQTIVQRNSQDQLAELQRFIETHPARRFILSRGVARKMNRPPETQPYNPAATGEPWIAFLKSEMENDLPAMESNRFAYEMLPSGPYEANLTYYGTWTGPDRVLMVRLADVKNRQLGRDLQVAQD